MRALWWLYIINSWTNNLPIFFFNKIYQIKLIWAVNFGTYSHESL